MFGFLGRLLDLIARRPALPGVVLALLAGAGAYSYVSGAPAPPPVVVDVERAPVVVARREVAFRDALQPDDFETRELPVEAIHPDALRSLQDVAGRFAAAPIHSGAQLLRADLADQPSGGGLARLVQSGSRALAVAVSDSIAAGGLVSPGDRVDVFAIFDAGRTSRSGSSMVVENVEVLAVSAAILGKDPSTLRQDEDRGAGNPKQVSATVTLSLDPDEAQRVAVAEEFGTLRLALRNPRDEDVSSARAVELASVVEP